jgi:hypothetical protein
MIYVIHPTREIGNCLTLATSKTDDIEKVDIFILLGRKNFCVKDIYYIVANFNINLVHFNVTDILQKKESKPQEIETIEKVENEWEMILLKKG